VNTCMACGTDIPAGQELAGVGDYPLCADQAACVEQMRAKGLPPGDGGTEGE
jgi:hypothetical protein